MTENMCSFTHVTSVPESPHAPTPTPSPLRSTPPWKKIYRLYKLGPPEAAQLKGAGCAELRKREHETIKWEEIVRVFFSSPTPVSDEEPGTGSGSLGIAGSFFRKSWRKISKKDLTNDSHNLQEVLQQGTEEKNEQLLKLSCLLISCSS